MSFDGGRGKSERGGSLKVGIKVSSPSLSTFSFSSSFLLSPIFCSPLGLAFWSTRRRRRTNSTREKGEEEEGERRKEGEGKGELRVFFERRLCIPLLSLSPFALLSSSLSLNRARGPPRREKNSFWISNSSRFKITCSSRHRGKRRKEERSQEKKSKVVEVEVEREIAKKRAPKRTSLHLRFRCVLCQVSTLAYQILTPVASRASAIDQSMQPQRKGATRDAFEAIP